MRRNAFKIILLVLCVFFGMSNLKAESLKELKDQLAKDKANQASIISRQQSVRSRINSAKNEISGLEKDIEKYEDEIDELLVKIDELNENINSKKKEIDSLLSFLQVSNGENIYLEYVFKAKTFSDFIYRSTVVEELTKYNDELIDEMYKMIEENKKLQSELKDKIAKSESSIASLEKKLKSYNIDLNDLAKQHTDVKKDIQTEEETLKLYTAIYKDVGCSEDDDIVVCLSKAAANTNAISSSGFVRPLAKGSVSSEWGYRNCPVHGRELHNGIDIAVAMNTDVFAAATGTVTGITRKSSCGGNIVIINHTVGGKQYRTVYMHLATINVSLGQVVSPLTVVGKSGGGGYTLKKNGGWDTCSTGAHLHFTIKQGWTGSTTLNPRNFISFPAKGKSFSSRW